jgi:hypothetical protein
MQAEMLVVAENEGDEKQFKGTVTIAGKTFSYRVSFQVSLSQYMTVGQGRTVAQMRELVPITVMSEGREIELNDREWEIFYKAAVPSAIMIHNQRFLAKEKIPSAAHAIAAEGGKILLRPEACKILAQPKFGCQFLDMQIDPTRKPN